MSQSSEPHVQIIVDREPVPVSLRTALDRVGARVSIRSLGRAAEIGISPSADVCVILSTHDQESDLLERILSHADDRACATLVLSAHADSPLRVIGRDIPGQPFDALRRLTAPEAGQATAPSTEELTGRIKALCEIRRPLRRMREELSRLRNPRRPAWPQPQVDEQLRLAGQVQSDLLPEPLAESHPLEISTLYLPADYISGDIYDIARLDEHHIGFSIADATGHGLPAALLTFLIKKSLRGKEIFDHSYRIIEPDELLGRLNEELLQASLSQCQFVTALHAIFDRRSGRMRWARGGCPYPILVRCGEPARLVASEGGLIGAFEQRFEMVEHALEPGDTLVFYSDGLDALLLHGSGPAARTLPETPWIRILEQRGPEPALQAVRDLVTRSAPSDWHADDITIIAVRMK